MVQNYEEIAERYREAWEYFRNVSEDERTVALANEMAERWLHIFYGLSVEEILGDR